MKRFSYAILVAVILPLAACNQPSPQPTPPAPDKPKVDVEAPGVQVKSDQNGTTVRTPNNEVDVNKK